MWHQIIFSVCFVFIFYRHALPSVVTLLLANSCHSKEISFPESAAAAAKSFQSCPTPCDPTDGSPPGSSVPGFSRQESDKEEKTEPRVLRGESQLLSGVLQPVSEPELRVRG